MVSTRGLICKSSIYLPRSVYLCYCAPPPPPHTHTHTAHLGISDSYHSAQKGTTCHHILQNQGGIAQGISGLPNHLCILFLESKQSRGSCTAALLPREKLLPLSLALMIRGLLALYPGCVGGEKRFFFLMRPGYEARGLLACNLHTAEPNAKSDLRIVFMGHGFTSGGQELGFCVLKSLNLF